MTRLLAIAVAAALVVPAFAQDRDKVSIRGKAENVSPSSDEALKGGILGTMIVDGEKDKDTQYEKANVKVTKATKIFVKVGGELKPATYDDLKTGLRMEITFAGPVGESFPVQATAGKIVILGR